MYWDDILIERWLTPEELKDWLLETFKVPADAVVVASQADHVPVSDDIGVLAEYAPVLGEFPMQLAVFTRRDDLDAVDAESAVSELSRRFNVRVLRDDDTVNPYRMVLVDPQGGSRAVHLDVDALDDEERFVISSVE